MRVRAFPSEVTVEIEDQGIGIETDDLTRVFEPFFRSDRSRARGTGGVGIALCRRIVEVHQGRIEVKSAQGQGTTVTVRLPLHAKTEPALSRRRLGISGTS